MSTNQVATRPACVQVPEFERLNFFYGQMLSAADFRSEQAYFREKMKLHNRCLHGWGVVCGLEVEPLPVAPVCVPAPDWSLSSPGRRKAGLQGCRQRPSNGPRR